MKRRMQKWVAAIGMVWAWIMIPALVFADVSPLDEVDHLELGEMLALVLALVACVVMLVIFLKMTKRGKETEGQQADQAEDGPQDKRED